MPECRVQPAVMFSGLSETPASRIAGEGAGKLLGVPPRSSSLPVAVVPPTEAVTADAVEAATVEAMPPDAVVAARVAVSEPEAEEGTTDMSTAAMIAATHLDDVGICCRSGRRHSLARFQWQCRSCGETAEEKHGGCDRCGQEFPCLHNEPPVVSLLTPVTTNVTTFADAGCQSMTLRRDGTRAEFGAGMRSVRRRKEICEHGGVLHRVATLGGVVRMAPDQRR